MKAIKVWGQEGPNPPKVAMVLGELDLPREVIQTQIADVKKPDYIAINPNGRLPAIHDPNTDITLWESGAIIEYLVERYDTKNLISFPQGTPDSYHAKQWLYFQVSGQGPYYGQVAWFKKYHSEKLPSAIERYAKEVNRVTSVLDGHLAEQKEKFKDSAGFDGPWLVGNKYSFADLAFIPYQKIVKVVLTEDEYNDDDFPHVKDWLKRMTSRKAVLDVLKVAFAFNPAAIQ